MFANGDDDLHGACKADEWASAGVGDDGDGEMRRTASHYAAVLKKEGAAAAVGSAGSAFAGDINIEGSGGVSSHERFLCDELGTEEFDCDCAVKEKARSKEAAVNS